MADDFKFQDVKENKAGDGQNQNPELNLLSLQAERQQPAKIEQPAEKVESAQAETFKIGDNAADSKLALAETQERIADKVTTLKSSPEGTALLNDFSKSLASMMEELPKDDPRMAAFRHLPKEAISSLT